MIIELTQEQLQKLLSEGNVKMETAKLTEDLADKQKEVVNPFVYPDIVYNDTTRDFEKGPSFYSQVYAHLSQNPIQDKKYLDRNTIMRIFDNRVEYILNTVEFQMRSAYSLCDIMFNGKTLVEIVKEVYSMIFSLNHTQRLGASPNCAELAFNIAIIITTKLYNNGIFALQMLPKSVIEKYNITSDNIHTECHELTVLLAKCLTYIMTEAISIYPMLMNDEESHNV